MRERSGRPSPKRLLSASPSYPSRTLPEHGRTNAPSPHHGHRRHFLQGEGSEGIGPMVPSSSGDGLRGYGGPLHVAEWEGREGQRGHGLVHLPRGGDVLR